MAKNKKKIKSLSRKANFPDCSLDKTLRQRQKTKEKERQRVGGRQVGYVGCVGETHLNFIFVCKFSIGFYAVRLVWKRKLSHRNMQVNGCCRSAAALAICAHALPWLSWQRLQPICHPTQLYRSLVGYETIETSLQSVHKVFTPNTIERNGNTNSQTTGNRHWRDTKTSEQIVRLLWLTLTKLHISHSLPTLCLPLSLSGCCCRSACLTVNKSRRA